jgi:thymidylate kinase
MIIVLDGIDGSGKSFCADFLAERLRKNKIDTRVVHGKVLAKGESKLYNTVSALNLGVGDIKHLVYLASMINDWEDMLAYDQEHPDSVTIKDRGWLTVLAYLKAEDKFRNLLGVEQLVTEYMNMYSRPTFTFCFMPEFSPERIKHRKHLKQYYANFKSDIVKKEYDWLVAKYMSAQNITVFSHKNEKEFNERNRYILNSILNYREEMIQRTNSK